MVERSRLRQFAWLYNELVETYHFASRAKSSPIDS